MKIRLSTIAAITAAVVSGTALFWTSQTVQKQQSALSNLQRTANSERESMRVLRAEWDYLNRPDRLEKIARETLGMEQPPVEAITDEGKAIPDIAAEDLITPKGIQPASYKIGKTPAAKKKIAAPVQGKTVPDSNSFQDRMDETKSGGGAQ
jgi:cell division protein FtsL